MLLLYVIYLHCIMRYVIKKGEAGSAVKLDQPVRLVAVEEADSVGCVGRIMRPNIVHDRASFRLDAALADGAARPGVGPPRNIG
jgi:hypothetical protein